jgi:hypothetical protein
MQKLEITSDCTCTKIDDDGEEVVDEQGYPVPADYCDGCWEFAIDNLDNLLGDWMTENNLDPAFTDIDLYIGGDGIGWQRRSGFTVAQSNAKSIIDRLTFNGEWTLRFTLDGKSLTVSRSSHDEPTGTGQLAFRLATRDEITLFENR